MRYTFLFILLTFIASNCLAEDKLKLATLSPHLTELVYSAGAGDLLVGVSSYSNYPEAATELPTIGDAFAINQELLLTLKPDLVFYWQNNIAKQMVTQVENLGIKTVAIQTQSIEDIPTAIKQIAALAETSPSSLTDKFLEQIKDLKNQNTPNKNNKKALIQISDRPIYTVNGDHWMSQSLNVCGLNNIFADLAIQSASVNIESIIERNPDVLIRFSPLKADDNLQQYNQINAIKNNHVIVVDPDHFSRPTLRLLKSIETICNHQSAKNQ